MVCAEERRGLRAAVAVAAGHGSITSGVFTARREQVSDLAGPPLVRADRYPTLESATAHQMRALEATGYAPVRILSEIPLRAGDRVSIPLAAQEGECVALRTVASRTLSDVDLELFEDGRKIAADRRAGKASSVGVCAPRNSLYQVDVIALKGEGESRLIAGYSALEVPSRTADAGLDFLIREAEMRFAAALRPRSLTPLEWANDDTARVQIPLTAGRCYGAAVVSAAPLSRVSITDPSGARVATWQGDASSALLALCPGETQPYTLDIAADAAGANEPLYLALFDSGDEAFRPAF
jgi:hypothetical protein